MNKQTFYSHLSNLHWETVSYENYVTKVSLYLPGITFLGLLGACNHDNHQSWFAVISSLFPSWNDTVRHEWYETDSFLWVYVPDLSQFVKITSFLPCGFDVDLPCWNATWGMLTWRRRLHETQSLEDVPGEQYSHKQVFYSDFDKTKGSVCIEHVSSVDWWHYMKLLAVPLGWHFYSYLFALV